MTRFTHFLAIDWSGAKGERHKGIALAMADAAGGPPALLDRDKPWSRQEVADFLRERLPRDTLIGLDLGISLPFADAGAFFPGWDGSPNDAKSLWQMIDSVCSDDPHLEAGSFVSHPEVSRYYRHGKEHVGDRFLLPDAPTREGRFRRAEHAQRAQGVRPVSNFNLVGAAQVGKSSLTGMRMLHQLRDCLSVWPIDSLPEAGPVAVEIYTSIAARSAGVQGTKTKIRTYEELDRALDSIGSPPVGAAGAVDDHSSDALVTAAWLRKVADDPKYWQPAGLTPDLATTEGWTFGAL